MVVDDHVRVRRVDEPECTKRSDQSHQEQLYEKDEDHESVDSALD